MAYVSKRGRRPNEYASKSAHSHVIREPSVKGFLKECHLPKPAKDVAISEHQCIACKKISDNPIRHIISIDGGYTEVPVRKEFPTATICFFQLGALTFSIEDLDSLSQKPFIDPNDISKLKQIQRLKFTIPVRNVALRSESTLTHSVRRAVYNFLNQMIEGESLIGSLCWFIFQEYGESQPEWQLSSCPTCETSRVPLNRTEMTQYYKFTCEKCKSEIYLTDVFRLHEAVDDELGAGGILAYVTTTIEQIFLVHLIRLILEIKPTLLEQILFIKDGPLAFFGQTANMHQPMRALVRFLLENYNLYLAGLEKSGPFVEHADEVTHKLENGSALILNNDYIYKYILPGKANPSNPYGRTTYYGNKLIFKTNTGGTYVVTLPTSQINAYPHEEDLPNLHTILSNVEKLRCDMYDSALVPIALANKLVSLANHPSSRILQRFAVNAINH